MEYNLPVDFKNRIMKQLGSEYDSFIESYQNGSIKSLRINPLKCSEDFDINAHFESACDKVPWEQYGYYYEDDEPGRNPLHNTGCYYIQEASAMAPVQYLDPRPGEVILDLCAAPGGKSTQIAGRMNGEGLLVSNEIVPSRAKILSENIERMGVINSIVISSDPELLPQRFQGFFDKILVDAPCSGEGMFRKHPEAMDEWSLNNVEMCSDRQYMILEKAGVMLKPGGRIVYSTCTFAPEEDELLIERYLENNKEFKIADVIVYDGMVSTKPGNIRLWPHLLRGEGHFLAVIEKVNNTDLEEKINHTEIFEVETKNRKNKFNSKKADHSEKNKTYLDKKMMALVEDVLSNMYIKNDTGIYNTLMKNLSHTNERLKLFGDNLYLTPEITPDIERLKVLRMGLHIGTFLRDRFEPSHALALASKKKDTLRSIELSYDGAQQYLKGMTISQEDILEARCDGAQCDISELKKGFYIVCYKGFGMGFAKYAGGSFKNHYPKGLRIK